MIEAAEAIQVESGSRNEPPRGIRFIKLREGLCRFPLGGPYDPPERFCGEPTLVGSPYCPACQRVVYTRTTPASGKPPTLHPPSSRLCGGVEKRMHQATTPNAPCQPCAVS